MNSTTEFALNSTPMPTETAIATPHVILPKNKPIAIEIITNMAIVLPTLPCAILITLHKTSAICDLGSVVCLLGSSALVSVLGYGCSYILMY